MTYVIVLRLNRNVPQSDIFRKGAEEMSVGRECIGVIGGLCISEPEGFFDFMRVRGEVVGDEFAVPAPEDPGAGFEYAVPDAFEGFDFNAEFFFEFTDGGLGLCFAGFYFSTGKADLERGAGDSGAAAHHEPAIVFSAAGDDHAVSAVLEVIEIGFLGEHGQYSLKTPDVVSGVCRFGECGSG